MSMPSLENPISEASETSLNDLMSKPPEDLEVPDLERIITALRSQREKFSLSEANPKPKKAAKAAPGSKNIDLTEIGL